MDFPTWNLTLIISPVTLSTHFDLTCRKSWRSVLLLWVILLWRRADLGTEKEQSHLFNIFSLLSESCWPYTLLSVPTGHVWNLRRLSEPEREGKDARVSSLWAIGYHSVASPWQHSLGQKVSHIITCTYSLWYAHSLCWFTVSQHSTRTTPFAC